jgi:hypothetical protein
VTFNTSPDKTLTGVVKAAADQSRAVAALSPAVVIVPPAIKRPNNEPLVGGVVIVNWDALPDEFVTVTTLAATVDEVVVHDGRTPAPTGLL